MLGPRFRPTVDPRAPKMVPKNDQNWCQKSLEKVKNIQPERSQKDRTEGAKKIVREVQKKSCERCARNHPGCSPGQRRFFGNPITNGLATRRQSVRIGAEKVARKVAKKVVREVSKNVVRRVSKKSKNGPEIWPKMVPEFGQKRRRRRPVLLRSVVI